MGEIKGINLVAEQPAVDPNMLFMHLEELRTLSQHHKTQSKTLEDRKQKKHAGLVHKQLDMLVSYLDEDYAETKKTLYPMLEAGMVSFEYMWALFKPNTICYTTTYGDEDEPRAFKVVFGKETRSFMRGTSYTVEGRYLEYDGKQFGMASLTDEVSQFSGARKIDTLSCYPIEYHKQAERVTAHLIERGKKFIALQGMNYKRYAGMAYVKKDEKILKVDVNGRIMLDPAVFRRVHPNYPLASIRSRKGEVLDMLNFAEQESPTTTSDSPDLPTPSSEDFEKQKQFRVVRDADGQLHTIEVNVDEVPSGHTHDLPKSVTVIDTIFSEEQLLTASSLAVGFSFSEKLWLEFAVSKVGEVQWNDGAFESLILPDHQKSIVKALVSSHAFHPSRSIDDIIAGKGKGLVAVLHGGPGLGKTLTVESIADLLRRPLYTVSAGDLGTSSSTLERELQTILDIAHAWGAVLLLDEADVFLEKRSTHDIHRNALVSIFLRLLEYFQGILFLTTNRVEVFDEAFISRIHLSLRYGELSGKAKKAVWSTFIQRVREIEGMQVETIEDKDLDDLSRVALNGRQIKNIVRAAQALAIHEDTPLKMSHISTVLGVAQTFERDLRGGPGYEEAMRGYT